MNAHRMVLQALLHNFHIFISTCQHNLLSTLIPMIAVLYSSVQLHYCHHLAHRFSRLMYKCTYRYCIYSYTSCIRLIYMSVHIVFLLVLGFFPIISLLHQITKSYVQICLVTKTDSNSNSAQKERRRLVMTFIQTSLVALMIICTDFSFGFSCRGQMFKFSLFKKVNIDPEGNS